MSKAAGPGESGLYSPSLFPSGLPWHSKAHPLPALGSSIGVGQRDTHTTASLGHSSEVLYHLTSFLMGMAPLK